MEITEQIASKPKHAFGIQRRFVTIEVNADDALRKGYERTTSRPRFRKCAVITGEG